MLTFTRAIMRFVRPRKVFGVFLTMCIVFIAPAITQRVSDPSLPLGTPCKIQYYIDIGY
jgi:hypothetical protein